MKKSFLNLGIHLFVIIWMLSSCNNSKNMESKRNEINRKSINDIPTVLWDRLSNSKIYFGHQSVGSNIISGIEDIRDNSPLLDDGHRLGSLQLQRADPVRRAGVLRDPVPLASLRGRVEAQDLL